MSSETFSLQWKGPEDMPFTDTIKNGFVRRALAHLKNSICLSRSLSPGQCLEIIRTHGSLSSLAIQTVFLCVWLILAGLAPTSAVSWRVSCSRIDSFAQSDGLAVDQGNKDTYVLLYIPLGAHA